ncbi:MAG: tetratricopeptide repeat protein, partial [Candidatus Krumholzibacteriia bacterium]
PLAVVVALLWLVHPLHTAALDHVVYRSEVLVGLFYLLTLYATMRAATSEHPRRWSLLAVVACFLGAGSKEVMATAPVVVLLHDRTFVAGSLRAAWQDRRALYVGLASSWILLAFLMATGERGASVGLDIEAVTPLDYARTQLQVVLHYVRLTFWPEPLVLHYRWDVARSFGQVAAPGLGVAVLVGLTAWALVRRPALGFLGAWFFAILAPTSSFVPLTGAIAAEHRCYLPLAAVTAVVVLGGAGLLLRPGRVPGRGASILGVVLAVAMAATLAALTVRRNRDYRSQESIWRDVLAERPSNVRAHNDLGSACLVEGRIHEALAHYTEALRIEPHYGAAHDNLGSALVRLGRLDEAAVHFEEALRVDPDYAKAHCNLASLRTRQGRYGEALRHLEEALRIDPLFGMAHYNWGHVLLAQGQLDSAITRFEVAAERAPHYAEVHHNLAAAFLQKGEYARALEHYRNTLEVEPEHGGALNNLAWLLATCPDAALRDGDAAVRSAEKALRVAPDESPGLLDTQAAAYAEAGRFENAVATAERARALAARAGNTQLVRKLEERLQLYRAGKAYRMAPARSLRRVR